MSADRLYDVTGDLERRKLLFARLRNGLELEDNVVVTEGRSEANERGGDRSCRSSSPEGAKIRFWTRQGQSRSSATTRRSLFVVGCLQLFQRLRGTCNFT